MAGDNIKIAEFVHSLESMTQSTIAVLDLQIKGAAMGIEIPVETLINVKFLLSVQSDLVKRLFEQNSQIEDSIESMIEKFAR